MLDVESIFTEIIEGKRSGFVIFEDKTHVAILDKYPIDIGHSLVIPKITYEKIIDMPKNEVAELFSRVPEIAMQFSKLQEQLHLVLHKIMERRLNK